MFNLIARELGDLQTSEQIKVINKQIAVYENLRKFVNTDTSKTLIIKEVNREGMDASVVMDKSFEDAFYYFLTDVIDELEDMKGEVLSESEA